MKKIYKEPTFSFINFQNFDIVAASSLTLTDFNSEDEDKQIFGVISDIK